MYFKDVRPISEPAMNILRKRYFLPTESSWKDIVNRVITTVLGDCKDEEQKELTTEMIINRYFVPNSPCLVNSGKENGGLAACFVIDFPDTIEGIYRTKFDFARIARKGGGCGTTLSKLRPEGAIVSGSAHGYAGGPIKFADTVSHDMDALTQSGFREMAVLFSMSVYHPDILKFINAKSIEGKISNANISVVVDNNFMQLVENDSEYHTFFMYEDGPKQGPTYKARDIFNLIVDGAWKNGEPGILFYDRMNNSPYKYSKQEIMTCNPCLSGNTFIQTVEGKIKIKDLVGKEIDVYCMSDDGTLEISKAINIRKTKIDAQIIRVQTSRGHIICTPDHLIYTKNRGYVQAKDLTLKDRLVGLCRKMHGEHYCSVSLTGNNKYEKEHRFIMRHYSDTSDKIVHHIDGNFLNNIKSNLEPLDKLYHNSVSNLNHLDWNEHDSLGRFIKKDIHKKKQQLQLEGNFPKGSNLSILGIEHLPYKEDVYDMEVEKYHNFIANDLIVHNCGEQGLPFNGVCNLGSLDISKFLIEDKILDLKKLEVAVRLGIRFLDAVIDKTSYPTEEIERWSKNNRPVGLGIMGIADYFLMKELAYGSDQSLGDLAFVLDFIYKIAEDESIKLGEEYGIPKACKKLPSPRRNITLLTVAPTGTVSLIAGCSSGIEPIFSEIVIRNDKTGTYTFENNLAEMPYFRCAVSANGATEVTWEEHVKIQATAQTYVDSGVSKTINFPNHTHRETIYDAFILAWKLGCKGLTVYRNMSRKVEVLTPKNIKKNLCPVCGKELIEIDSIKKCPEVSCGFILTEISQ
jgi:ribonucleoside-diphosphate reductase alpha chain